MASPKGLAAYSNAQGNSQRQMVEEFAPLVKRIANHLMARLPSSVLVDDLTQAGMIGLLEAARNYDSGKGASFSTYASIRIRGAMIDEVRKGDWVPRSVHRNARRISEAIAEIEASSGHDASDQEVADHLGIELGDYYTMLKDAAAGRLFAYDELATDEDSGAGAVAGGDDTEPYQGVVNAGFQDQLANGIDNLPEREKLVLALYYDEELNLKEIGAVLGVSESRVSQIHSQAVVRLRSRLREWS